jgi:hypothetical protein
MTGRYPMRTGGQHGVALTNDPTWILEGEVLLPQRLAEIGYRCVGAGKWHLGHGAYKYSPTARGFHEFFGGYNAAQDHWEHIQWFIYPCTLVHLCPCTLLPLYPCTLYPCCTLCVVPFTLTLSLACTCTLILTCTLTLYPLPFTLTLYPLPFTLTLYPYLSP